MSSNQQQTESPQQIEPDQIPSRQLTSQLQRNQPPQTPDQPPQTPQHAELLDPQTCPNRLRKAETVLRNRTDRIQIVVSGIESDFNTQAILRTAESLGFQDIINLTTSSITTSTLVHNITKGSHTFISIQNTTPNELINKFCRDGEEVWYVGNGNYKPSLYGFDSQKELIEFVQNDLNFYQNDSKMPQNCQKDEQNEQNNQSESNISSRDLFYCYINPTRPNIPQDEPLVQILTPNDILRLINPTTTTTATSSSPDLSLSATQPSTPSPALNPTPNDELHKNIFLARVPLPLTPEVFGNGGTMDNGNEQENDYSESNIQTQISEKGNFLKKYQISLISELISSTFLPPTNTPSQTTTHPLNNSLLRNQISIIPSSPIGLNTHTESTPTSQLPAPHDPTIQLTQLTPLITIPKRIFLVFDPKFDNLQLQLIAHRIVYLPTINNHIFSQSNHAALYMDRLLALCPEAIGNLDKSKRDKIRLNWYKKLAKNDKILTNFLKWAQQPDNIPLLSTLRMDLIEKWWAKTGRPGKATSNTVASLQAIHGSGGFVGVGPQARR
jgi:hypothetical protein